MQCSMRACDEECLNKASNRLRNQFVGCMHAHNELTILNRMLMFTDGELHNSAQSVQMWCMLQILAAKLFETWIMLAERFLQSNPPDVVWRLERSWPWHAGWPSSCNRIWVDGTEFEARFPDFQAHLRSHSLFRRCQILRECHDRGSTRRHRDD